jgi:hypothetical protein
MPEETPPESLSEEEVLAEYDRLAAQVAEQNANYTDAEVEADIEEAVRQTRRARR